MISIGSIDKLKIYWVDPDFFMLVNSKNTGSLFD